MGKNKENKSKEELIKASGALHYEMSMLNNCAKFYEQREKELTQPQHSFLKNILIESFCVHLRNLIDFFGERHKGYTTCQYFLPGNSNVTFSYNLKEKYGKKVNNLLSHLTFHRLTYGHEKKPWELGQIAGEVNKNFREFIKNADPNLLCDELKKFDNYFTSDAPLTAGTVSYSCFGAKLLEPIKCDGPINDP